MGAWIKGAGAVSVALALLVISGIVGTRRTTPTVQDFSPAVVVAPSAPIAAATARSAADGPAHAELRARAAGLIGEYFAAKSDAAIGSRWAAHVRADAHVIYESGDGQRFITMSEARAECSLVDSVLRELDDPRIGSADLCDRWQRTARALLTESGADPVLARAFTKRARIDPAVRVLLIYSAWKRTGGAADAFERVSWQAAPVYPQSQFSVARRTALDRVMRELRVIPTAETPAATVTSLLDW